jgi:VanZ family protein
MLNKFSAFIKPLMPACFWGLIIIISSLLLMEQRGLALLFPHQDKIVHVTLFALLTFAGYLAYSRSKTWLYVGLMGYGGITELLQGALTVTRYASIYDWMADITGIILSALAINLFNAWKQQKVSYAN